MPFCSGETCVSRVGQRGTNTCQSFLEYQGTFTNDKKCNNSNREAKSRPGRLHGGAAGTCDNDAVLSTMRQEKTFHPKQQKNKCNLWRLHLITLLWVLNHVKFSNRFGQIKHAIACVTRKYTGALHKHSNCAFVLGRS